MRDLLHRLRKLPLRSKLGLTFVAGGFAVLAIAAFFSFRYWHDEILETAQQQALLSATSAQATLESLLSSGRGATARRTLERMVETEPVEAVRVHAADGILLSAVADEEGAAVRDRWIPAPSELPRQGTARTDAGGKRVVVFAPLAGPLPSVLELHYSVEPLQAAVRRGTWMGVGLVLLAMMAFGFVVITMLEREVVGPLHRMEGLLAQGGPGVERGRDELREIEASVVRLIRTSREVEQRAAERDRQLAQREGFAQVGELAAEMAHEFKRPLASISSAMDLLEQEYVLDAGSQQVLHAMHSQLDRLSETMRDLFSLARPVALERRVVPASDVMDDALVELAGHPALQRVDVARNYETGAPPLFADERRLRQAIQNVVLNAAEAMPAGGTIELRLRTAGAEAVELSVRDTGVGMTEEAAAQALKPFHSTKATGTGLGLPLVVRVVAAHDGRLAIESAPGAGTSVVITLPVSSTGAAELEEEPWRTNAFSSSTTTS